jgi:hypothetical protein
VGVWQDANTLKKRPVFRTDGAIKRTGCSVNEDRSEDDDDIQVIKMVDPHGDEISQSGNSSEYFSYHSFLLKVMFNVLNTNGLTVPWLLARGFRSW